MSFISALKIQKIKRFIFSHPYISVGLLHALLITLYSLFTFFWGSGHIIFIDLTEGINLSDASNRIYYAYANNWGEALAEKQRIVPFSLMWIIFKGLHLGEENFVPFRILFGYYLSIGGFVFLLSSIKSRSLKAKGWPLFFALFVATAFYLYNPWMTNRILHNFLYFSTFTVAVHLGFLYRILFKENKNKGIYILLILNGLLLGTFTTTPHTAFLILTVTIPFLIVGLINRKYYRVGLYSLITPLIGMLSGLYWIVPFILYRPTPDRVESLDILDLLSQKASFLNVLKLQGYWWTRITPGYYPEYFNDIPGAQIIFSLLYLIPLLLFLYATYYYRKQKITFIVFMIFLIGLALSSYTFISREFYEYIMFQQANTKNWGWLFREIEKFSYLISLSYALGVFIVLNIKNKRVLRTIYVFIFLSLTLNFSYLVRYTNMNLRKVLVPYDYYRVNELFLKDNSEFNIAYYPQVQFTKWSPSVDSSNYISNLSSDKPALPNVEGDSYTKHYINTLLEQQNIDHIDIGDALNLVGVKYLIIRNDMRGNDMQETLYSLDKQESLLMIWKGEYLTVYENRLFNGLLEVKQKKLVTNLGLNFFKSFNILGETLTDYVVEYTDLLSDRSNHLELDISTNYLLDQDGYRDLAVNSFSDKFVFPSDYLYETNPNADWAIISLTNKTHAESNLYFNNFNIGARQFNYGKEVSLSLGGLTLNEKTKDEFKSLTNAFVFISRESFNIKSLDENTAQINFFGEERDYVWNIFRSNKVEVTGMNAIGFEGVFVGDEFLEPHIKFYYYDEQHNSLGVQVFYPEAGNFSGVFKVPRGVDYVDLSIWVRGKGMGNVGYEINKLKIYDVGSNYTLPELDLSIVNEECRKNCALYARILESTNYPSKLEFLINNEIKSSLNNTRTYTKYKWVKVTDLPVLDEYKIKIINLEGFNSIAALLVVDESSLIEKENLYVQMLNSPNFEISYVDNDMYFADNQKSQNPKNKYIDKYIYYSPVKYAFNLDFPYTHGFLVFKKPFKPAWQLSCNEQEPKNPHTDFSVVWDVNLNDKTCVIYYSLQNSYELGLILSTISVSALGAMVLTLRVAGRK